MQCIVSMREYVNVTNVQVHPHGRYERDNIMNDGAEGRKLNGR